MAGGYDGSVRIDTSMDPKGFNAGLQKLSAAAKTAFASIGKKIGDVARAVNIIGGAVVKGVITGIVAGLVSAAVAAAFFGIKLIHAMSRAISRTSEYGKQIAEIEVLFANVQGAVYSAFSPLITAALPYIKIVVDWLVTLLNTVAQVTAALLGQSTYMQYVAGSAATAATNTGKLADNTNKAAKAAKGALAAFDEINVLQQESADSSGGGGGGGGAMQYKETPLDSAVIRNAEDQIMGLLNPWILLRGEIDKSILGWKELGKTITWFWDNIKQGNWEEVAVGASTVLQVTGEEVRKFLEDNQTLVASYGVDVGIELRERLDTLKSDFHIAMITLQADVATTWTQIKTWWRNGVDDVKNYVAEQWPLIQALFTVDWWKTNLVDPMKKWWSEGMADISRSTLVAVNQMIGFINNLAATVVSAVNKIITTLKSLTGINFGQLSWNPIPAIPTSGTGGSKKSTAYYQPPYLATGAVIPPNAAFAAILGDQRSGKNIEAPESLIRQIVREETQGQGSREIVIRFEGSLASLMRELKPHADRENTRVGTSLITGGSTA